MAVPTTTDGSLRAQPPCFPATWRKHIEEGANICCASPSRPALNLSDCLHRHPRPQLAVSTCPVPSFTKASATDTTFTAPPRAPPRPPRTHPHALPAAPSVFQSRQCVPRPSFTHTLSIAGPIAAVRPRSGGYAPFEGPSRRARPGEPPPTIVRSPESPRSDRTDLRSRCVTRRRTVTVHRTSVRLRAHPVLPAHSRVFHLPRRVQPPRGSRTASSTLSAAANISCALAATRPHARSVVICWLAHCNRSHAKLSEQHMFPSAEEKYRKPIKRSCRAASPSGTQAPTPAPGGGRVASEVCLRESPI